MKPTILRKLINDGLTVRDLIERLQECDQNAVVVFTCDYGDYNHTQQALPVGSVETMDGSKKIAESAYSRSGLSLEDQDGPESYCPNCDEMYDGIAVCPECKGRCVDEDGCPAGEEPGDEGMVVILS